MSRAQADAVALARDMQNWEPTPEQIADMNRAMRAMPIPIDRRPFHYRIPAEPLSDLFYRNAIASGSIIPPAGESASVRRSDYLVGLCVLCLIGCGVVFAIVALCWRG